MPFTDSQTKTITEKLQSKITGCCPSCGQLGMRKVMPEVYAFASYVPPSSYPPYGRYRSHGAPNSLSESLNPAWGSNTNIPVMGGPQESPEVERKAMPCICLFCSNCGFTEFYNVHVLGLADALGIPKAGVPIG